MVQLIIDPVDNWSEHVVGIEMLINLLKSSQSFPNRYGRKGNKEVSEAPMSHQNCNSKAIAQPRHGVISDLKMTIKGF